LVEFGRLRWRCRRGTTELERILAGFLARHGDQLSAPTLEAFERLLEHEDDQLADWLINGQGQPLDESLRELVQRIRESAAAPG